MSDYYEVYNQRLNRYGNDYQSRITGQRQKVFEQLLFKSIYRIEFQYGNDYEAAILEPHKQDQTRTMQYLLTRLDTLLEPGTIIDVENEDAEVQKWMVYYLENKQAKGYNRYIVLKMSHYITWETEEGTKHSSWVYMHGKENSIITDVIESGDAQVVYTEDGNMSSMIMPINENLHKEDYFEIIQDNMVDAYQVRGFDRISTKGIEYVTIEREYVKDKSPIPKKQPGESGKDYYWLTGGDE